MAISSYVPSSRVSQAGVCTSTTRPASPYEGQMIYETDTDKILVYTGAAWNPPWNTAWGSQGYVNLTSGNISVGTSIADLTGLSVTFTANSSRLYLVSWCCVVLKNTAAGGTNVYLADGSNNYYNYVGGYAATTTRSNLSGSYIIAGKSGSQTVKLRAATENNTATLYASSGEAATLAVMDIGPA